MTTRSSLELINELVVPAGGRFIAFDGKWKEDDHPRAKNGQFGSGGSSSSGTKESKGSKGDDPKSPVSKSSAPKADLPSPVKQADQLHSVWDHLGRMDFLMSKHTPGHLKTREAFVQEHGIPFEVNEKTYEGPRQQAKMCFMNATHDALGNPDRTYVEGYITVHGLPIEHAWTVDHTGQVYDPTIHPSDAVGGYYGIPFDDDYLQESILKNGYYGLLGHRSRETLEPLLAGERKDFKKISDPGLLSSPAKNVRLAFADRVARSLPPTDQVNSPERTALRKSIAESMYNTDLANRKQGREATILLGLPGAGKSTFANPLLANGALEIDNDIAKAQLPEFRGGVGAFSVHEEAADITRGVLEKAVTNGDNIVWPRVDSPDKIKKDVEALTKAGYKVNVHLMKVTPELAVKSVVDRFLTTGRYVSPALIEDYGTAPTESYHAAVSTGLVNSHEIHERTDGSGFKRVE